MKKILSLLFVTLLFASCETVETVTHFNIIKTNPDFKGGSLNKVLIVGVASSNEGRALWEDLMAYRMNSQGMKAVASNTLIPEQNNLSRESVLAAVEDKGFDGVIVTKLLGRGTDIQHTSTDYSNVWGASFNMSNQGQSVWLYGDVHEYNRKQSMAYIEVNVFTLPDAEKIWIGQSETFIGSDTTEALNTTIDKFISTLAQEGLLEG